MILAVDLAARFSAGVALGRDREVHMQFDSWGRTQVGTASLIAEMATLLEPELIIIEDVPYGLSKQFMVKPVLRLQGMVIAELSRAGLADRTLFVAPSRWQQEQHVWKAGPPRLAAYAAERGYVPPDLFAIHAREIPPTPKRGAEGAKEQSTARSKIRESLRKAATDYVDAFLIADWAACHTEADLRQKQGVQPIVEGNTTWLSRPPQTPSPLS